MSNPPWMPLYVRDYIADTSHLRTVEHGAYLLLIMHYWQKGRLPADDTALANITRLRIDHWRKMRARMESFFGHDFRSHKRIDLELQRAAAIGEINSERARQAANKRWSKHARSNGQAMLGDAHTQRKKDLTEREIEVGAVDKSVENSAKGSAEEASQEAIQRMRRRKGTG